MSHFGIIGVPKYAAPNGGNGTVTVPSGGILQFVVAHASSGGATVSVLGGQAIPIPNGASPTTIALYHQLFQANASANTVVGTGTDMLVVHWINPGHTKP
jgi:hypothetical protein